MDLIIGLIAVAILSTIIWGPLLLATDWIAKNSRSRHYLSTLAYTDPDDLGGGARGGSSEFDAAGSSYEDTYEMYSDTDGGGDGGGE